MARNRPSDQSDAQFALFVEQMKNGLDVRDGSEFDHIVRKLVGAFRMDLPGPGSEEGSDDLQGNGAASSPSLAATFGNLPEPPDFDVIESDVHEAGASRRANLMVLIGHLAFGSLINESLLIYILMVLLPTDEPSAVVVFSISKTMRTQLDLVSGLAWIRISDRATRLALDQVVKLFNRANQIRNEFLHPKNTVDGKGAITHTKTILAIEKGSKISFAQQDPIDQKRLDRVAKACREMSSLNRKIWSFCRGFRTR